MNSYLDNQKKIIGRSSYKNRPIIRDDDGEKIIYVFKDEWKHNRIQLKNLEFSEGIHVMIWEDNQ